MRTFFSPALVGGLIVACALCLTLFHLGRAPLWDYDEATYAQNVHEALTQGNVITPSYRGAPFLEKPPLYLWFAEGASALVGESAFSLRLPSALSGVALVFAVMLLSYELSGSSWAGVLAGAILLTTSPLVETARQMRLDVMAALWITLAAYAFARALKRESWFFAFWAFAALALLTKSALVFFALALLPVFAWWYRDISWLRKRYFWLGALLGGVIALPWHLWEIARFGQRFWSDYFGINVAVRFREDLFNRAVVTNADYVWYLANFAVPWTQVFVLGLLPLGLYWKELRPKARAGILLSLTMTAIVIAVFFSAATKAPTYLLPLYPFAAVAISLAILEMMQKSTKAQWTVVGIAILLCVGIGAAATIYNGFHFNPYYAPTDELSQEEQAVAAQISAHPGGTWYVFGNDREVGSIMYYTQNTHPVALTSSMQLKPGDLVLMYADEHANFFAAHSAYSSVALHSGAQLLLLEIVSEN